MDKHLVTISPMQTLKDMYDGDPFFQDLKIIGTVVLIGVGGVIVPALILLIIIYVKTHRKNAVLRCVHESKVLKESVEKSLINDNMQKGQELPSKIIQEFEKMLIRNKEMAKEKNFLPEEFRFMIMLGIYNVVINLSKHHRKIFLTPVFKKLINKYLNNYHGECVLHNCIATAVREFEKSVSAHSLANTWHLVDYDQCVIEIFRILEINLRDASMALQCCRQQELCFNAKRQSAITKYLKRSVFETQPQAFRTLALEFSPYLKTVSENIATWREYSLAVASRARKDYAIEVDKRISKIKKQFPEMYDVLRNLSASISLSEQSKLKIEEIKKKESQIIKKVIEEMRFLQPTWQETESLQREGPKYLMRHLLLLEQEKKMINLSLHEFLTNSNIELDIIQKKLGNLEKGILVLKGLKQEWEEQMDALYDEEHKILEYKKIENRWLQLQKEIRDNVQGFFTLSKDAVQYIRTLVKLAKLGLGFKQQGIAMHSCVSWLYLAYQNNVMFWDHALNYEKYILEQFAIDTTLDQIKIDICYNEGEIIKLLIEASLSSIKESNTMGLGMMIAALPKSVRSKLADKIGEGMDINPMFDNVAKKLYYSVIYDKHCLEKELVTICEYWTKYHKNQPMLNGMRNCSKSQDDEMEMIKARIGCKEGAVQLANREMMRIYSS